MLVLRRKAGEAIVLNGAITIYVLAVEGERVKLGISAPPEVVIVRSELLEGPLAGPGGPMGGPMSGPRAWVARHCLRADRGRAIHARRDHPAHLSGPGARPNAPGVSQSRRCARVRQCRHLCPGASRMRRAAIRRALADRHATRRAAATTRTAPTVASRITTIRRPPRVTIRIRCAAGRLDARTSPPAPSSRWEEGVVLGVVGGAGRRMPMTRRVDKVVVYITRGDLLLVFTHPDFPEAGLQVPAGTVEVGEAPADAARREAHEETGLERLSGWTFLGERERDMRDFGRDEVQRRFFFHARCD